MSHLEGHGPNRGWGIGQLGWGWRGARANWGISEMFFYGQGPFKVLSDKQRNTTKNTKTNNTSLN